MDIDNDYSSIIFNINELEENINNDCDKLNKIKLYLSNQNIDQIKPHLFKNLIFAFLFIDIILISNIAFLFFVIVFIEAISTFGIYFQERKKYAIKKKELDNFENELKNLEINIENSKNKLISLKRKECRFHQKRKKFEIIKEYDGEELTIVKKVIETDEFPKVKSYRKKTII